ncbi:hypothetical protein HY969_01765 [Candidatus Kaiserbacteria bacterium]|nr:hypothetical protein [Candidatus Kaiserbacteria bacterium]
MNKDPKIKSDFEDHIKKLRDIEIPLAGGEQKTVYIDPDNDRRVIVIFRPDSIRGIPSPDLIEYLFYIGKIAHLLFPKNIPALHKFTKYPATITRERVFKKENHDGFDNSIDVKNLEAELVKAGFKTDSTFSDFARDEQGNLKYVDNIYVPDGQWHILEQVVRERLQGKEQENALRYVSRAKQAEDKLNSEQLMQRY